MGGGGCCSKGLHLASDLKEPKTFKLAALVAICACGGRGLPMAAMAHPADGNPRKHRSHPMPQCGHEVPKKLHGAIWATVQGQEKETVQENLRTRAGMGSLTPLWHCKDQMTPIARYTAELLPCCCRRLHQAPWTPAHPGRLR